MLFSFLLLCILAPFLVTGFNPLVVNSSNDHRSRSILSSHDSKRADPMRRSLLISSATGITCFFLQGVNPAFAKYGDSSNMELPNYIEYLIEKNESLDSGKVLFKGADPAVLLTRLQEANKRLADIPSLAEEKKWSQISGLITGPLGTLAMTINQIVTPDSSSKVMDASKKVKADVIAIGQAASKKNAAACTENAKLASKDLDAFVRLAFE